MVTSQEGQSVMQGDDHSETVKGIVNPRLSDVFGLILRQDEVDFVLPHIQEDLPLCLDPFLLWKSGQAEYRALHAAMLGFVDQVRLDILEGRILKARALLAGVSEPVELGLGYGSGTKRGSALGPSTISTIVNTLGAIPQLESSGLDHIETLALLIPGLAEDRISDLTASVIKGWLAEYTERQCVQHGIPTKKFRLMTWDADLLDWRPFSANLPFNPLDGSAVLLAPLDLLRRLPWINYEDYYRSTYAPLVLPPGREKSAVAKKEVLAYNRTHFDVVTRYVASRESNAGACAPDPIFSPLRLSTLQKKLADLRAVPTGRQDGADKKFEDLAFTLLSSLLYPELDLAADQVRTESGVHIRDAIFHNDGKTPFLTDLRHLHGARQAVFELKNVASLETEHVNQLHRYLDDEDMGRFGVLVARTPPPRNVQRNIVDLHSSKRAAVLCLDDSDIGLMVSLLESGRRPIEALRKKYVEFTRRLPK